MRKSNIVIGFFSGLFVGAVAGMLLAPDRGSETRRKITSNSGDLLNNLKNKYNSLIDDITSKLDEVSGEHEDEISELIESTDENPTYGL